MIFFFLFFFFFVKFQLSNSLYTCESTTTFGKNLFLSCTVWTCACLAIFIMFILSPFDIFIDFTLLNILFSKVWIILVADLEFPVEEGTNSRLAGADLRCDTSGSRGGTKGPWPPPASQKEKMATVRGHKFRKSCAPPTPLLLDKFLDPLVCDHF